MVNDMIRKLTDILKGKKRVALGGHMRPDGDCTGSCLGLYLYIKKNHPQMEVDVYLEDIPKAFDLLKGGEAIKGQVNESDVYDLFISLDCGDEERLGFSLPLFKNAKSTLCIDHHISNTGFADENIIIPTASSTCELVYTLMDSTLIDVDIATALFTGIAHDTGIFRFDSTSPQTMMIAADLLSKGIKGNEIIDTTFYEKTFVQTKITGLALYQSELLLDGRIIVSSLSADDMSKFEATTQDLEGIVSQMWMTKDIAVALFLYELEDGSYKVSLRSGDVVDVSLVATHFGGGGHKKAAGCSVKPPVFSAIESIIAEIKKQL